MSRYSLALSTLLIVLASSPVQAGCFTGDTMLPVSYPGPGFVPLVILDQSDFDVGDCEPFGQRIWHALDVSGNSSGYYLFSATGRGLDVWNVTNPDSPSLTDHVSSDPPDNGVPFVGPSDFDFYFQTVDSPTGHHDTAVMGSRGSGLVIWNATNKNNVRAAYQDDRTTVSDIAEVYSFEANNGTRYAVATSFDADGLLLYDMDRALNFNRCRETSGSCSNVLLGRIDSGVSGFGEFLAGDGDYVAMNRRAGINRRIEVWNLSNPLSPNLRLTTTASQKIGSLALWVQGGSVYLAGLDLDDPLLYIYNISCVTGSGTCNLGSPIATRNVQNSTSFPTQNNVFFSRGSSTPYLYVGNVSPVGCSDQREYIFDVSNPSNPDELTPQNVNPNGYWGHYYEDCGGFPDVRPRGGVFHPMNGRAILYRAVYKAIDSHEIGDGVQNPPDANFSWSPLQPYAGQSVTFTDTSISVPAADDWDWTFEDGTPSSAAGVDQVTVVFGDVGNPTTKTVTLDVANSAGSDMVSREITVRNPAPVITGASASPNPAQPCGNVQLSALGVSGFPTPTVSWVVNTSPPTNLFGAVANWSVPPDIPLGNYTATATATNGAGTPATAGTTISVQNVPLGFSGAVTAQNSVGSGFVTFTAVTTGATEWRWNFGDGTPLVWESFTGTQKTHTYAGPGTYTVTVEIRGCDQGTTLTSTPIQVEIQLSALGIVSFGVDPGGANCSLGSCNISSGTTLSVSQVVEGGPDSYEYDWNGDGVYDEIRSTPATSHRYCEAFGFPGGFPRLLVRRGGDSVGPESSPDRLFVSGSACTPPSTPTGLNAAVNGTSISLVWSDNANSESGYRVLRSLDGLVYREIATLSANSTGYADQDLSVGTYTYKVQAFGVDGVSGFSNTAMGEVIEKPLEQIFADNFESGN
ncbi:MAG: PKD domain-containing protein, partial [Acidobacteriota bacterium]